MKRSAFLAGIPAFAAAASPAQTATLRVGATANDTHGEAYYALDMGFFANAGLAIDLQTFPNGGAIASAIASGALDVGVGNPVQLANGIAHGIPFVYFAAGGLYDTAAPTTVMCVAKDSPIRDPKDLEGKAVANPTIKARSFAGPSYRDWSGPASTRATRKTAVVASAIATSRPSFSVLSARSYCLQSYMFE